jgi:hypothetical protein
LNVTLAGAYFKDLIFNLNPTKDSGSGTATVTAHLVTGPDAVFTYAIGNGANFGTLIATGTEQILSVDISTSIQLADIRQTRVSGAATLGVPELPTPEPATLGLVAGALVGFGAIRRRRR